MEGRRLSDFKVDLLRLDSGLCKRTPEMYYSLIDQKLVGTQVYFYIVKSVTLRTFSSEEGTYLVL